MRACCLHGRIVGTVLACGLALLHLASCSYPFLIGAEGDLKSSVVFHFYEFHVGNPDPPTPISLTITRFSVIEVDADLVKRLPLNENVVGIGGKIIWEIEGAEFLSSIEYGKSYPHLDTIVAAKPLDRNSLYLAKAGSRTTSGAAVGFWVDADGFVVEGASNRGSPR